MAVKPAGICWVITTPGVSAGKFFTTSRMASVPPVDAPIVKCYTNVVTVVANKI